MVNKLLSPRVVCRAAGLLAAAAMFAGFAQAARVSTAIDYAVSEGGAATLNIPLQVPRGIGGMEPQLSLSYSSTSGNGLLGLGWTLNGPSMITRCPRDLVNDQAKGSVNFDTDDRFCLDGQRLLVVPGTATYGSDQASYRTQRDTFARITSLGAYAGSAGAQTNVPNSFKVETKAGLILEFGISANSQVKTNFAYPGIQTVNRWMLQRVSDRSTNGSFVEFVYCAGIVSLDGTTCTTSSWTGSAVLHYIRYTNRNGQVNGENAVVLHYDTRPDAVISYHAGSPLTQQQRITSIETYREFTGPAAGSRGKVVKGYDISYEPQADSNGASVRATVTSRIQTITERDDAGNKVLPLRFSIATDAVFGQAAAMPTSTATAVGAPKTSDSCGGVISTRVSMMCP